MRLKLTGFVVLLAISLTATAGQSVRVETIDARSFEGQLLAVSDKAVQIKTSEGKRDIPRNEIVAITIAPAKKLNTLRAQGLLVTDADRLAAWSLSLSGDKVRFKNQLLGDAELPLVSARQIYMPGGNRSLGEVIAAVEKVPVPATAGDVMYVEKKGGYIVPLRGIVKGIDKERVTFTWRDKDRSISRNLIMAVHLATVKSAGEKPAGVMVASDGSEVAFKKFSYDGSKFTVETKNFGRKSFALSSIAAIRFFSESAVNLATLKPHKVTERGFFGKDDHRFLYRVNKSVGGSELRLDGREYGIGLGLHSYSELTWKVGGKYSRFVALLGIDDAVKSIGGVTVTFLIDGKVVGKPVEVSGKDKPQTVRLDIKGASEFTIRVDFGRDNMPAGDHLDIVSARLIK